MICREQITAVILAGGRGHRLDGMDKGLLPFRGRPLIDHVIDIIQPQVGALIISANRHRERYAAWGSPVMADSEPDFSGPLAGISHVLEKITTPYLLVVPCDMPFLPKELTARLAQALLMDNAQAALARGAGRLQPLCVLLRHDVAGDLHRFRASGDAKVARWLLGLRHVVVDFYDRPASFHNINTPSDLMADIA